jgi:hypothetical protein
MNNTYLLSLIFKSTNTVLFEKKFSDLQAVKDYISKQLQSWEEGISQYELKIQLA